MKVVIKSLLVLSGRSLASDECAPEPNVTYGTGIIVITPGTTVSIQSTNTGGAVSGNQYFQVNTFACNSGPAGTADYINGIGTSALFNNPRDMAFERLTRPTASG
jgi:hypothetical protein